MLNSVALQGRFTADPELKTTTTGKVFTKFTLASERDFADANGNRSADFIGCTAWGKTAEFISTYFAKGRMVIVHGRVETRSWQPDSGEKRYTTEINVDHAYFCDSKPSGETTSQPVEQSPSTDKSGFIQVEEDDLPF